MTDIEAKIKQLRDELNRHNYNYYVLNQPTIGDICLLYTSPSPRD